MNAQILKSVTPIPIKIDSISANQKVVPTDLKNADEIFLKITYASLVDITVIAYYYKNEFYFPFKELCDNLEINSKISNTSIEGFINDRSNRFQVDFFPNKVSMSDTLRNFVFSDFLKSDFDYFFNSEFYRKIFGLEIKTDFGTLTSSIRSRELLPVYQRFQREKSYEAFAKRKKKEEADVLFPRDRRVINGGIFDYNVGYTVGGGQSISSFYNFKLGGELVGGDAQISTSGEISADRSSSNNLEYLWRYVFDKNEYLRTISFGKISLTGLYPLNYTGVRVSNDQVEPRRTYETRRVYEKTNANWSVEVYISNQLIAVTKSDAAGDFYFDMPLSYGTTLLEMKFYGPLGEYYEESRLYQTPYYLLRPNEFVYFADFGNVNNFDKNVASIKGGYGINEWITTEMGFQYLENDISEKVFYNSTTARLFGEYLLNLTIAPQAYYKFAADVLYFSQSSFGIEYTRYTEYGYMNPGKIDNDFGANFFIPFRLPFSQVNLKGSFDYAENSNIELFDYSLGSSVSLDGFNPSVTYNYIKSINNNSTYDNEYLDIGLSYFIGSISHFSRIMSGSLISFRSFYDTKRNRFQDYNVSISTSIKNIARIQLSHSHNFYSNSNNTQLQLVVYLDNFQLNSSISPDGFRLGALGSFAYDGVSNELNGFNRGQVGRSSAVFKFFLDSNGNSKFDEGEEIINNGNVIMGTSVIEREKNGIILVRELDPYTIYTVDIDETAIKNPLLVPGIKRFSFVADPNSAKKIEIPFYIAGEIDGSVFRKFEDSKSPVAGIKININDSNNEKVVTLSTYSDGTFYYFGLKPGSYTASIEKDHLDILGIKKDVKPFKFTVKPKENGDIITDAIFIIE